ncbi:MAG: DUF4405 domain-containing protein [Chlorobium sp.]|nr:MAG: DUF4405 domain-containing protein [Chlorobium sp.]
MKRSFSWRVFTSFGLFLSFFIILVSGVILYIFPGRAPGFVWEMFGLSKPAWQNQHIIFGFAFAILSLCHLFFINWKAFFSYLKSKTKAGLQSSRELIAIVVLTLLFGFGTFNKVQPFCGILDLGKSISNSWDNKGQQGPDKRVDMSGESQVLAFAEPVAERGTREEEFYGFAPYSERGHVRERGHSHGDQHNNFDEEGTASVSQQRALLQQDIAVKPDTSPNIVAQNTRNQTTDFQAPDDELHRRTTASCASCHNTSRW